ncbi:serine hydrolase domain-containing protein [Streptomyces spongiae]|uniref:Beta-lactamase family protein n=1 Tax=Streptomyces spongiae TaxID=565072 RepID=A0A5N8XXD7_9ACTN|nr:serine hydrolase domain-containing protein [Streptomyces spongiae]MPY64034.1 beta-lactamase family protein [Streptomyces spongiae]
MAVHGRRVRTWLTAATAATAAAALAAPAFAVPADTARTSTAGHSATREAMDAAVADGVPGVTARVEDKHGTWTGTSGVGNLKTGQPPGPRDHYRVGSVSKTFIATVLLQLEAEGELSLDDSVEKWLPGVVHGNGHDGSKISLRRLLNHTSGIYNVLEDPEFQRRVFSEEFLDHRYDTWTAESMVAMAMRNGPDFAPGGGWKYSNTNYILAGMIIKRVTGNTYQEEIRQRIIEPLGLKGTRSPGTDPRLPRPHSRGYTKFSKDPAAPIHDVTEYNPSVMGASGDAISTSADLIRFYTALLRPGRLLEKEQLAEMMTTEPQGDGPDRPRMTYGLGLYRFELGCGKVVWGHGGDAHGSSAAAFTTRDGRHALALDFNAMFAGEAKEVIEAEFCGK